MRNRPLDPDVCRLVMLSVRAALDGNSFVALAYLLAAEATLEIKGRAAIPLGMFNEEYDSRHFHIEAGAQ